MKEFLLYLWQLPQNIVGLLLLLFYRHDELYAEMSGRRFYYTKEMPSGISLGNYIIMNRVDLGNGFWHEYGHSVQSRKLGPLYLLVIGLPSLIGNIYDRIAHKSWTYSDRHKWYYSHPWEKWADELGGVKRHFSE